MDAHITPHVAAQPPRASALSELAARIRTEHQAVVAGIRHYAEQAMAIGDLLIRAKDLVGHGHFGGWLERYCAMSDRTARSYMRLAKNREALLGSNRQSSAELSIDGALKAIAGPTKPKDHPSKPKGPTALPPEPKWQSKLLAPALNSVLWSEADEETRRKFLNDIGPRAIFDRMPDSWLSVLGQWFAERASPATKPTVTAEAQVATIPADLSIPPFLKRDAGDAS